MKESTLNATYFQSTLSEILAPDSAAWREMAESVVKLTPTPLDKQPSAYVQTAWQNRGHGQVVEVIVQALHNDDTLAIKLQWNAEQPNRSINDVNVYADACAILFPANGTTADLQTMGSPEQPVVAWHWRAGTDRPFAITAKGIGTVERAVEHGVQSRSRWLEGKWQVVLARALQSDAPSMAGSAEIPVAFAVWSGAGSERGGLKSYSPEFHQLIISS